MVYYGGTGHYTFPESRHVEALSKGRVSPYQELIQATLIRLLDKFPHFSLIGRGHICKHNTYLSRVHPQRYVFFIFNNQKSYLFFTSITKISNQITATPPDEESRISFIEHSPRYRQGIGKVYLPSRANHHNREIFSRLQVRQDDQHLCVSILKHSFNMYQCALVGDGRKPQVYGSE